MMNNRQKRKVYIAVGSVLIAAAGMMLVKFTKDFNRKQQLEEVLSMETEADYLSGTAADEDRSYQNIKSVFLKTNDENIAAHISFFDGKTVPEAKVTYGKNKEIKLSWDFLFDEADFMEEEGELSFSYSNCYPNGFYIISEDGEIYDYTETNDRTAEYSFKENDITEIAVACEYTAYDEQTYPEDIKDAISEAEAVRRAVRNERPYAKICIEGDLNCHGCCDRESVWMIVNTDSGQYVLRNVENGEWEISPTDELPFSYFSEMNMRFWESQGMHCLIIQSVEENIPVIYVSGDYGETFKRIQIDIPLKEVEKEDDLFDMYDDTDVELEGNTLKNHIYMDRLGEYSMTIEFDLYKVLHGAAEKFSVCEEISLPAD